MNQNYDPKFKGIGNEIKFKIVSRLKLNEKAERIHCAFSDNVKIDNLTVT